MRFWPSQPKLCGLSNHLAFLNLSFLNYKIIFTDCLYTLQIASRTKTMYRALEKWLSSQGYLLLLQKNLGLVPSIHRGAHNHL